MMPNEQCSSALKEFIDQFDNQYTSSAKRAIECFADIILTNDGKDSKNLYENYKESKSQWERVKIRHGKKGLDELKEKYNGRPRPTAFSILTKEYWISRKGLSEEEAIKEIAKIQSENSKKRHKNATPESYKNIPHCVEFWINKGYSLEESIALKTEFNQKHVRSYENMVKRYGKKLGIQLMLDIQDRRKNTLMAQYGTTTVSQRISKASLKLFIPLYKRIRKLGIAKEDIYWGISGSKEFATRFEGKNYFYDFTIKSLKIIIEFNGCYWHAREDLEWKRPDITKEESLKTDSNKKSAMLDRGFNYLTVWEDDDISAKQNELYNYIKEEYDKTTTKLLQES